MPSTMFRDGMMLVSVMFMVEMMPSCIFKMPLHAVVCSDAVFFISGWIGVVVQVTNSLGSTLFLSVQVQRHHCGCGPVGMFHI